MRCALCDVEPECKSVYRVYSPRPAVGWAGLSRRPDGRGLGQVYATQTWLYGPRFHLATSWICLFTTLHMLNKLIELDLGMHDADLRLD